MELDKTASLSGNIVISTAPVAANAACNWYCELMIVQHVNVSCVAYEHENLEDKLP